MDNLATNFCLICYLPTANILLCNCKICSECLYEWIIYKNYSSLYKEEYILTCPNHKCKSEINARYLNKTSTVKQIKTINEILFKKYTYTNTDIHKCPNNFCNYIGWYENTTKCSQNFICDLCSHEWYNPTLSNYPFLFYLGIIAGRYSELFYNEITRIRLLFDTKPCPTCRVLITVSNDIYCSLVCCPVCSTPFCYLCLRSHKHDLDYFICSSKDFIFFIFIFLLT
jgi:hypothetical protein